MIAPYTEERILQDLKSEIPDLLRNAAFEAAECYLENALPLIVDLFDCPTLGVQEAAEVAIKRIRGIKAVESVLPMLSASEHKCEIALEILRDILRGTKEEVYKVCDFCLHSTYEDPYLRFHLLEIINTHYPSCTAKFDFFQIFVHDEEPEIRALIVRILEFCETIEAEMLILTALYDNEDFVRLNAIEALTRRKTQAAVPIFIEIFENSSPCVQELLYEALTCYHDNQEALKFLTNPKLHEYITHKELYNNKID